MSNKQFMKYIYPKSFFKIWLSQIVANNAFIQDCRITSDNIGRASAGDLPSLRDILVVYADSLLSGYKSNSSSWLEF